MRLCLRLFGFAKVARYLSKRRRTNTDARLSKAWLRRLTRRLSVARALSPVHTTCLEHSLAAWWEINHAGGAADLRLGAHPFPFHAHAWTEHNGTPVVDNPEELLEFRPFQSIDFSRI
jgi:hypothetical protein